MSEKRNDNHPRPSKAQAADVDADLLEADELNAPEGEGADQRRGDRESHHASAQPRPVRPKA